MKERLDIILVQKGFAVSREKAKALILSGNVYVDGQKAEKAGNSFDGEKIQIEVRGGAPRYVSRGGLKLEKAVEKWRLDFRGMVCMDIGASTGGFTDCMLQNGAAKVYALDVGHGQLAESLREDSRVICMEGVNFRYTVKEDIGEALDFASADVSFISLTQILVPARELLKEGGRMVCLIKPQFEAGKGRVGKKGVVRDPGIHREVIAGIVEYAYQAGFLVRNLDYSPVRGPEGNREYLLLLEKAEGQADAVPEKATGQADAVSENAGGQTDAEAGESAGLARTSLWKQLIAKTVEEAFASSAESD